MLVDLRTLLGTTDMVLPIAYQPKEVDAIYPIIAWFTDTDYKRFILVHNGDQSTLESHVTNESISKVVKDYELDYQVCVADINTIDTAQETSVTQFYISENKLITAGDEQCFNI